MRHGFFQLMIPAMAGGGFALVQLVAMRVTVFGKAGTRMSLLAAIASFSAGILLAIAGLYVVTGALTGPVSVALLAFAGVEALLGRRICGPLGCEEDEAVAPDEREDVVPSGSPLPDGELGWGVMAADGLPAEAIEDARSGRMERLREYLPV